MNYRIEISSIAEAEADRAFLQKAHDKRKALRFSAEM